MATFDSPIRVLLFQGRALGSAIRLQVRVANEHDVAAASAAWAAVQAEFAAVDAALSRFRADSELTALNRLAGSGCVVRVSWRLRTALAAIHRAGCLTSGRFDATVIDVLERIGEHGAPLVEPPPQGPAEPEPTISAARASRRAGLAEDPRTSLVRVPGRPVDLGGIGKGLALRWATIAAASQLPDGSGLLLDAGGDLAAAGDAAAEGWLIGIDDPVAPPGATAEPLAVFTLRDGAVATSSVGTRQWTAPDGRRVHHIIDPATREPARSGLLAVTVAAADPAWAEVWTKALFLAGADRIAAEARGRGLAAWWLDAGGRLWMTPAARSRSTWVAESRVG